MNLEEGSCTKERRRNQPFACIDRDIQAGRQTDHPIHIIYLAAAAATEGWESKFTLPTYLLMLFIFYLLTCIYIYMYIHTEYIGGRRTSRTRGNT